MADGDGSEGLWLNRGGLGCLKWGFVILLGLVAIGFFLPPGGRVGKRALRANCQSNLRQIGLAINGYSEDYDQDFPPSLAELWPDYVNNAKLFKCPATADTGWQDFVAGKATEKSSSYVYLPGRFAAAPGDFVLAYDRSKDHHVDAGINAVFVDGHVEWVSAAKMAEFMKRIADQEVRLPELRRKWEAEEAKKAAKAVGAPAPAPAPAPVPGDSPPAVPGGGEEEGR